MGNWAVAVSTGTEVLRIERLAADREETRTRKSKNRLEITMEEYFPSILSPSRIGDTDPLYCWQILWSARSPTPVCRQEVDSRGPPIGSSLFKTESLIPSGNLMSRSDSGPIPQDSRSSRLLYSQVRTIDPEESLTTHGKPSYLVVYLQ
jgi:hypothetical protein